MKRSRKLIQQHASKPVNEKIASYPFYDDTELAEKEAETIHVSPDGSLDMVETGDAELWDAVEKRLEGVSSDTVRRNIAKVDVKRWLQASKELATKAKKIAAMATSKEELFKIDAMVDAFDRDLKERKVGIEPCRLHCQHAIRDGYARLT